MRREDAKIGMTVVFGRENGEKTEGVIIKMNLKTAKVKTTTARGYREAGKIFNVDWSFCTPTTVVKTPSITQKLEYNPFSEDNIILEAILNYYNNLSPENLSCDGEAPLATIQARRSFYNNKLRHLFNAFGREVSESEIYNWYTQKMDYQCSRKLVNDK